MKTALLLEKSHMVSVRWLTTGRVTSMARRVAFSLHKVHGDSCHISNSSANSNMLQFARTRRFAVQQITNCLYAGPGLHMMRLPVLV